MKKLFKITAAIICFAAVFAVCMNAGIKTGNEKHILKTEELNGVGADCILILGAGIRDDNTPSDMLRDRLDVGIKLYFAGASDKIIMSGDHGRDGYDEVNVMKQYAVDAGVPSEDIFMDHAGFSTYDSITRAKEIFLVEKMIVVTQRYHLYRALYIASAVGITAYGADAALYNYAGQTYRDVREFAARIKDSFYVLFSVKPQYLGETIPVSGNGDITNDK